MSFLFGQPNSVERAPTRKLLLCGVGLTVCGIATVLNGAIASALEAEKTYHLEHFTNTHWITSVFMFAGIAAVLVDRTKINAFLILTVALCCASVSIGLMALVADCVNIYIVNDVDLVGKSYTALSDLQLMAMKTYSYIDMITCLLSTGLSLTILALVWRISSRFFADVPEFKSPSLLVLGIAMVAIAFGKGVLWLIELVWLKNLGDQARFLFLHYTIDEPVWNAINYTIGALIMIVATKGTRVLMYVTLGLASLSAYPTLIYLWIDYRWYSNVKMSELTVHLPKPPNVLVPNMVLGAAHLVLLLIIVVVELRAIHKAGTQLFKVVIEADQMLRQAVVYGGLMLILAGCVMTVSDVANLVSKTFYRVFYPTEQKLPFSLFVAGPLCLLALHKRMSLYFLPTAFAVLIFTAHTSIFMVVAYIYLSYNTYFSDQLCELFHFGKRHCETQLERLGSWSHFIEAALSACIFMLCIYLAFVLGRLMKLHKLRMTDLSLEEMRKKRLCELCIMLIGLLFLLVGVLVLLSSMFLQANVFSNSPHPLLTLHSTVYRSCLAVALIAYPIVQVATAKDILFYPLRSLALCVISFVRFVDILTQLDYRNVGQDTGLAWALFSLVELLSLGGHFATICLCATLLDVALNRVPRFDFGEAPEVTSNGRHSSRLEIKESEPVGYRQLETNDEYGDTQ